MRVFLMLLVVGAGFTTSAMASDIADPFESYNRAIFKFNNAVDDTVVVPLVKGYRAVVPEPVRDGAHNVLSNLKSPLTIGNNLLQGDLSGAGKATVRTVVNTILGVGGIFDVAGLEGFDDAPEDFGQTLAVWGVPHGPYIVPPLWAPGSLRDHTGAMVDGYVDPVRLWLHNTDRDGVMIGRTVFGAFDSRDRLLEALADLKRSSIDYYAAVKSAYGQRRAAEVTDEGQGSGGGTVIPRY